ncbi:hypothetical protein [Spirulina sp. CS-785/01]|uniref:hypothetical protein n=1 Tax=Spirulina sp. CS-785/01 TaxID=3021716 RepID=UPI003FA6A31C
MLDSFVLAPRYGMDDESIWLKGIDPSRNYWLYINGVQELTTTLPGLVVADVEMWIAKIKEFRGLQPQEKMQLERAASTLTIHCVSSNCYAIEAEVQGAPVWHLFDKETLESLLRTAHPDWMCAPQDVELGRELIMQSFSQPAYV